MLSFLIVDESGSNVAPTTQALITEALLWQLNGDVSREWGGGYSVRWGALTDAQPTDRIAHLKPSLPDVPDAEAYHSTLPNGAPVSYFSMVDISGLTSGSSCLSVVLSHELIETAVDPGANRYAVKSDGKTLQALEGCDRVQDCSYAAPNGVYVSNFLLQSAFDPGAPGPWDKMGALQQGEALTPGGYEIDIAAGGETTTQGKLTARAASPYGRIQRRLDRAA